MKEKILSAIVMTLFLASMSNVAFTVMPVFACCGYCPGNIVANWSFEDPVVSEPKTWDIFASIPGWTAEWIGGSTSYTYNSVVYTRPANAYFELQREREPTNGRETPYCYQWIELDSDWFGPNGVSGEPANIAIYQNLTTVPGKEYKLTFAYSPRPNVAENQLIVKWDGNVVANISASGGSTMQWTTHTVTCLTATSTTTELRFEETGPPDSLGMFLDAVCVKPICTCP